MLYSAIGLIDVLETMEFAKSFLTDRELEAIDTLHPARKMKRISARALLKYLYVMQARPFMSEVKTRYWDELSDVSIGAYQCIEIVNSNEEGRYLTLYNNRFPDPHVFMDVSYNGQRVAVSLSNEPGVALDFEKVEAKTPLFYKHNFTSYEREWVYDQVREELIVDQAFAFLWTVKEGLIKSGKSNQQSVWYIPQFSIEGLPSFDRAFASDEHFLFQISDGRQLLHGSAQTYFIDEKSILTVTKFW